MPSRLPVRKKPIELLGTPPAGGAHHDPELAQLGHVLAHRSHQRRPQLPGHGHRAADVAQARVRRLVDALQKQVVLEVGELEIQLVDLGEMAVWVGDEEAVGVLGRGEDEGRRLEE